MNGTVPSDAQNDLFGATGALYVSTDLQKYSTQNQADAIRDTLLVVDSILFANTLTRDVAVFGWVAARPLQALISDVQGGRADFKVYPSLWNSKIGISFNNGHPSYFSMPGKCTNRHDVGEV
jgi:hypothetical protein